MGDGEPCSGKHVGREEHIFPQFPFCCCAVNTLSAAAVDINNGFKSRKMIGKIEEWMQQHRQLVCTVDQWQGKRGWKRQMGCK